MERDSTYERIKVFYGHLFPHLYHDSNNSLSANPTFGAIKGNDGERLEDIQKGWTSQPEEFDYECEVVGKIPAGLEGTLFRNGPGLLEVYGVPLVHPIDGDGMICSIKIKKGKAHFKSAYVNTSSYSHEKEEKKMIYRGMMGTNPPSFDPLHKYKNPSNTNVYYWGGKLLSVWESGLPYELDVATLKTKGKIDLNGSLSSSRALAAHARYESSSDSITTFSLKINNDCEGSSFWIHEYDNKFSLIKQLKLNLKQYFYCHDILVTPNYYIIFQSPFYNPTSENIAKILEGSVGPGMLMNYLVIPRNAKDESDVRYFSSPPGHIYHHINAFEEGDKIHLSSVILGEKFNMEFQGKVNLSNTLTQPGEVFDYTFNLKDNTSTRRQADLCSCEFPYINPFYNGKPYRFSYLMASDYPHAYAPYQEIIKHDREGKERQVWSARGEHGVLGEPVFVPRRDGREEDDGWVIAQLYLCRAHKTQYVILDAKNIAAGPIARVILKHHTPYGFHGTFTSEI